jgi:hypothetical protein
VKVALSGLQTSAQCRPEESDPLGFRACVEITWARGVWRPTDLFMSGLAAASRKRRKVRGCRNINGKDREGMGWAS